MSQSLSEIRDEDIARTSESRGEPEWLAERRLAALSTYRNLPIETSPLYTKYTDARRMDEGSVVLPPESESSIPEFMSRRLAELEGVPHAVQVGTHVARLYLP